MGFPAPFIREATAEHTHTVIFLHGRGSTASMFAAALWGMSTSKGLNLFQTFPNVRWVFPSAQLLSSAALNRKISQWFDMMSRLDSTSLRHVPGLQTSVEYVLSVVRDEIQRLGSADRVVLGGISQGQATALHALLCGGFKLGAFVGACGWLPLASTMEAEADLSNVKSVSKWLGKKADFSSVKSLTKWLRKKLRPGKRDSSALADGCTVLETPVFLGHGTFDAVINVQLGRQARDVLNKMRVKNVVWKEYVGAYPNGHWIKEPEQLDDIAAFLVANLQLHP